MKVIKDAMMKWLDSEIERENGVYPTVSVSRLTVLLEVKARLQQVIHDEFKKMQENKDA